MNAVALDVPGADLEGVQYGVDFMKKANLGEPIEVGKDVVVIGGGYTAMDCSRTRCATAPRTSRSSIAEPAPSSSSTRRSWARRSEQ